MLMDRRTTFIYHTNYCPPTSKFLPCLLRFLLAVCPRKPWLATSTWATWYRLQRAVGKHSIGKQEETPKVLVSYFHGTSFRDLIFIWRNQCNIECSMLWYRLWNTKKHYTQSAPGNSVTHRMHLVS